MTLFPVAGKAGSRSLTRVPGRAREERDVRLERPAARPVLDDARPGARTPDRSGPGLLDERFAFCQTMPLDEFLSLAEALRPSGYRPVRFRPYADGRPSASRRSGPGTGGSWRDRVGVEPRRRSEQSDEENRTEKFLPVDVAGYVAAETDGKPADRYRGALGRRFRRTTRPGSRSGDRAD